MKLDPRMASYSVVLSLSSSETQITAEGGQRMLWTQTRAGEGRQSRGGAGGSITENRES
jgi:hypothetical protein